MGAVRVLPLVPSIQRSPDGSYLRTERYTDSAGASVQLSGPPPPAWRRSAATAAATLGWAASYLAGLGCRFRVLGLAGQRGAFARLGGELQAAAAG